MYVGSFSTSLVVYCSKWQHNDPDHGTENRYTFTITGPLRTFERPNRFNCRAVGGSPVRIRLNLPESLFSALDRVSRKIVEVKQSCRDVLYALRNAFDENSCRCVGFDKSPLLIYATEFVTICWPDRIKTNWTTLVVIVVTRDIVQ